MAEKVKRVRYFDHQFLHEKDFTEEQAYHIRMRKEHNRLLHTSGIVHGLDLSKASGVPKVKVSPGMAIDPEGQEIVLAEEKEIDIDVQTFSNKSIFVTIAYSESAAEETSETGVTGKTRWIESSTPAVNEALPTTPHVILGRVRVDSTNGFIIDDGILPTQRLTAGAVGGDMKARSLTLTDPKINPKEWPHLNAGTAHVLATGYAVVRADGLGTLKNYNVERLSRLEAGKYVIKWKAGSGIGPYVVTAPGYEMKVTFTVDTTTKEVTIYLTNSAGKQVDGTVYVISFDEE